MLEKLWKASSQKYASIHIFKGTDFDVDMAVAVNR